MTRTLAALLMLYAAGCGNHPALDQSLAQTDEALAGWERCVTDHKQTIEALERSYEMTKSVTDNMRRVERENARLRAQLGEVSL